MSFFIDLWMQQDENESPPYNQEENNYEVDESYLLLFERSITMEYKEGERIHTFLINYEYDRMDGTEQYSVENKYFNTSSSVDSHRFSTMSFFKSVEETIEFIKLHLEKNNRHMTGFDLLPIETGKDQDRVYVSKYMLLIKTI